MPDLSESKSAYPQEMELPSGRVATIIRGLKGRDQIRASRQSNGKTEELALWLLVGVVDIDGQPQTFEDFLDMDLEDLLPIQEAVAGKLGKRSAPQT